MTDNGFIKLYRSLMNWEWYSDVITTRVFIHLLFIEENDIYNQHAAHQSTNSFYENQHTVCDEINTPVNNNIRSIKNKELKENKNNILPPISPRRDISPQGDRPPKNEYGNSEIELAIDTSPFGDELKGKIQEWLKYKQERKEAYKPTGFKSLIGEIKNNVSVHGESEVISLINQCMCSGYKGIIFDILNKNAQNQGCRDKGYTKSKRNEILEYYPTVEEFFGSEYGYS